MCVCVCMCVCVVEGGLKAPFLVATTTTTLDTHLPLPLIC